MTLIGEDSKGRAVQRPNRTEMATIERDDQIRIEAFSERHHRCVGAAERKIGVLIDKVSDPRPVISTRRVDR